MGACVRAFFFISLQFPCCLSVPASLPAAWSAARSPAERAKRTNKNDPGRHTQETQDVVLLPLTNDCGERERVN